MLLRGQDPVRTCRLWMCAAFVAGAMAAAFLFGSPFGSRAFAQQAAPAPAPADQPSFEVAAIKPSRPDNPNVGWDVNTDRITIENLGLKRLIVMVYGLKSKLQVVGGPEWMGKKRFDIKAKVDDAEVAKKKTMSHDARTKEWQRMYRSLLADRFQLKASQAMREMPVLALVVDKSGAKLTPSASTERSTSLSSRNTNLTAKGVSMEDLAEFLGGLPDSEGRMVVDRTGLAGKYDFALKWSRYESDGSKPESTDPGLFTALEEQLGLKLKPAKSAVPVVIVESATEPAYD